jgi:ribosomal protein S27AE
MEASKCPKCGEEPNFLEHMEKWYCYECNSYVADDEIEPEQEIAEEPEAAEVQPEEEPIAPEEPKPEIQKELVEVRMCENCGQPLKWIEKYQRDYCYSCKKYAVAPVKDPEPVKAPAEEPKKEPVGKSCPDCAGEMKFVQKYDEWYCYTCKKYPLHKSKAKPEVPKKANTCPKCNGGLRHIEKYQRYYCDACRCYAPKANAQSAKKVCPTCRSELKFIAQYNEWYCYKCKKYPLRPGKPVLLL